MKRILILAVVCALCLSFFACVSSKNDNNSNSITVDWSSAVEKAKADLPGLKTVVRSTAQKSNVNTEDIQLVLAKLIACRKEYKDEEFCKQLSKVLNEVNSTLTSIYDDFITVMAAENAPELIDLCAAFIDNNIKASKWNSAWTGYDSFKTGNTTKEELINEANAVIDKYLSIFCV